MSENTKIEWCDHSWSPWRGCTKVSPGCAHCYAETLSKRNPAVLGNWGKGKPRVLAKNWGDPVRWNKVNADGFTQNDPPVTVFPSLCDWLDEEVPVEWLANFLALIDKTPNLTWLLLTKRPENFRERLNCVRNWALAESNYDLHSFVHQWMDRADRPAPANVWVGTSVEDQIRADERIPALLRIPAAGRFLSVEPLLGPVTLPTCTGGPDCPLNDIDGHSDHPFGGIYWVIVGGESGPGARPCNVDWIRSLVSQCKEAAVPCFVKQLGARPCSESACGATWRHVVTHKKGGDPAEWPEHLRVREFPPTLGGSR